MQLTFFTDHIATALREYDQGSIDEFRLYHAAHPEIYNEFKRYTFQMFRTGRERYGAQGVYERIRWDRAMQYPEDDFKLNNNFVGMYARLVMTEHPELKGFFETRRVFGIQRYNKRDMEGRHVE